MKFSYLNTGLVTATMNMLSLGCRANIFPNYVLYHCLFNVAWTNLLKKFWGVQLIKSMYILQLIFIAKCISLKLSVCSSFLLWGITLPSWKMYLLWKETGRNYATDARNKRYGFELSLKWGCDIKLLYEWAI